MGSMKRSTLVLGVVLGVGCSPKLPPKVGYWDGTPAYGVAMGDYERAIAKAGAYKATANPNDSWHTVFHLSLGISKLYSGDLAGAESHWNRVASLVDSDIGKLRGIQSIVGSESVRYFKGSAYERAALHYYRGLTFYLAGNYENAAVCFRRAIEVEATSARGPFAEDNAALWYLYARALKAQGDSLSSDNIRVAAEKATSGANGAGFTSADEIQGDNLVILIDTGDSATWEAGSTGDKWLLRQQAHVGWPLVRIDGGEPIEAVQLVNWYHQGITETLGGGDIARKAKSIGRAALNAVVQSAGGQGRNYAATADVRTWDELPDSTWLVSVQVPPGPHDIEITYRLNEPIQIRKNKDNEQDVLAEVSPPLLPHYGVAESHWPGAIVGPRTVGLFESPLKEPIFMKAHEVWVPRYRIKSHPHDLQAYKQTLLRVGVQDNGDTLVVTAPRYLKQASLSAVETISRREFNRRLKPAWKEHKELQRTSEEESR